MAHGHLRFGFKCRKPLISALKTISGILSGKLVSESPLRCYLCTWHNFSASYFLLVKNVHRKMMQRKRKKLKVAKVESALTYKCVQNVKNEINKKQMWLRKCEWVMGMPLQSCVIVCYASGCIYLWNDGIIFFIQHLGCKQQHVVGLPPDY